ncbi:hypothetical protein IQ06DRAFT_308882 [Phaeosphaeriaceae sp. SRC1lsM3a]|nr:hypothetical protein IQ06DRAFT_308882 [Stagonospora sp. SRC1lsM3a]
MLLHIVPSLAILFSAITAFASPLSGEIEVKKRETDDTRVVLTFPDHGNAQLTVFLDCAEGESLLVRNSEVVPTGGNIFETFFEFTATTSNAAHDVSIEPRVVTVTACKNSPNPPTGVGSCAFHCSETNSSGRFSCGGGDSALVISCNLK